MTDTAVVAPEGVTDVEETEGGLLVPRRMLGGLPIVSVSETIDWLKMMVYGRPGVGKTLLLGSSAEVDFMRPVLYLNIEGGAKTLRAKYPQIEQVHVVEALDKKGKIAQTAWQRLQKVYEDIRRLPEAERYRTYIIDNTTEAHKLALVEAIRQSLIRHPDRDRDPEVPERHDYLKAGEMFRRMIRAFRDLEAHVLFTAWEQDIVDEQTGAVKVYPSLSGKLAGEAPGFLDLVCYMYTKRLGKKEGDVKRYIMSQPDNRHIAKDRSDKMPQAMEMPTMAQIAALAID